MYGRGESQSLHAAPETHDFREYHARRGYPARKPVATGTREVVNRGDSAPETDPNRLLEEILYQRTSICRIGKKREVDSEMLQVLFDRLELIQELPDLGVIKAPSLSLR